MQTIFEWDGSQDIQPFQIGGNATTKTITTEETDVYVKDKAHSLRVYANDAASGKSIQGLIDLPVPTKTGVRLTASLITPLADADWLNFALGFNAYDGTNRNTLAMRFNSAEGVTKAVEIYNASAAWEAIAGDVWPFVADYWVEVELIGNLNATGVNPTYNSLRVNQTSYTTFPDDGDSVPSANAPVGILDFNYIVDNGASRYMYLDRLKVEVW
tara:strand:- start:241 stop:882 length:642 start_codon:yes stop_codon:yes gene_type:complete